MPPFPDEYLPPITTSLYRFVSQAGELIENDPHPGAFTKLMLSGLWPLGPDPPVDDEQRPPSPSDVQWRRSFINGCQDLSSPVHPIVVGDFDSVIGITKRLPFAKAITWHLIPLFKETLTKNTHIIRKIPVAGALKPVPLHRIPNFMVLKFDTRHQGRVFLPRLYSPNQSPSIPIELFPVIYERAVLPAIKACSAELASTWPVKYQLAERLSRDDRGHLCAVTRDIPPNLVQQFAHEFLSRLESLGSRFQGAFFEIEVKGVKGTSLHDPADAAARTAALSTVLDPLSITAIPDDELEADWFVDVALEVHKPGECLLWTKEGHNRVIHHALPSITREQARALTNSSNFTLDPTAHLTSFAGFRLEPGRLGRADHVSYLNVYTTDKAATYQLNNGIYRRRTCADLLPNNIQKLLEDIDKITETLSICGGLNDDDDTQDGAVRLEARVNIGFVEESLTAMPRSVINHCIVAIPSVLWW